MLRRHLLLAPALLFAAIGPSMLAQSPARGPEQRTSAAMERARAHGPLALHAFLAGVPKGGDLHNHLAGAVYAETWLKDAAEDHVCIDPQALSFVHQPAGALAMEPCAAGSVAAATLGSNQRLYGQLVDAFSMRSFVPSAGISGHDQFFASFDRFRGLAENHTPEWVDEVATRAAGQNEQYLELMNTPGLAFAVMAQAKPSDVRDDYAAWRKALLAGGLAQQAAAIREQMEGYEKTRSEQEHCGTAKPLPACRVEVRYLYQVLRNQPLEQVFAQILLGFEVVSAELASGRPHYVGLNLVQPEDWQYSMGDYTRHMQMIAALRPLYPGVPVALHAGELAPGLVPPEALRSHIRQAVETAGAERIGHGVTVMDEERPAALLAEMAERHVLVEINLTSNDVILGVKGSEHPLPLYRKFGVPLALSTDDEGVSRIDLTHEYVRAAEEYGLTYADLKQMARNSLEYSFLPGQSFWLSHDFTRPNTACVTTLRLREQPKDGCKVYLALSAKASQQWELEQRFAAFEQQFGSAEKPPHAEAR
jgi:adenosine deaminase